MSRRVPDLFVEQLLAGELSDLRAQEVRAALEAAGDDRLALLERSNRELLTEFPPENVAPAVRLRAQRERRSRPWMSALVAVVAVVTLTVLVTPALLNPSSTPETRLKGQAPELQLHRLEGSDVDRLDAGEVAAQGDRIQLSYIAAGQRYGVIVSIDGRGAVTLHEPRSGALAAELRPGGEHVLDRSYELDDAPGFERFFFVTGAGSFPVEQVQSAAESLAERGDARTGVLELPAELSQESFLLDKP